MYKIYSSDELKNKIELFKKLDPDFSLKNDGFYFIVFLHKLPIGYALVYRKEDIKEYYIDYIYIEEEERYKSYGTHLIHFIINDAIENGVKNVGVNSDKKIEKFLLKAGFTLQGDRLIITNVQERKKRYKENKKVVLTSIFWNIILSVVKIGGGIFTNSRALLTDGFNSLSDVATSFGILVGVHFSNIPGDEEHPYGHEKIESVIGIILGIFMILTAFELGKGSAVLLFIKNRKTPSFDAIYIAIFSMVVKYFMYRQKIRVGVQTSNEALIADAKDSRNDMYASLGVIIGVCLSIYISNIFDILVSLLVALLIFKEGVSVIFETSNTILDKQDMAFLEEIKRYIYDNTQIQNVHDLRMRKSGDKIFLTLHIRVPKNTPIFKAHEIADDLEDSILTDFPHVKDVFIHVDSLIKPLP